MMPKSKPKPVTPENTPGRYALEGIDRTIHEKARLGILTSLITRSEGLLFNDLKELCALTDGNLNRHLKVLEDAGLVEIWKGFKNNRPQTLVRITHAGRAKSAEYLAVLQSVVTEAAQAQASAADVSSAAPARLSTWGFAPG
jgi:DNA-binding MarR family transcriptional regulator